MRSDGRGCGRVGWGGQPGGRDASCGSSGHVEVWERRHEQRDPDGSRRGSGRRDGPEDGRSDQRDEVLPTRDAQVCGDRRAERPTGRDNGPEICRECDASYSWRVSVSQNGNPPWEPVNPPRSSFCRWTQGGQAIGTARGQQPKPTRGDTNACRKLKVLEDALGARHVN